MKVIINSCLLTELLKNFQTSLDNMRVIGKTIIFKCQSISAYA